MNIRDNLKAFYVGDRQGTAIYVGSTKVWPSNICTPIVFKSLEFKQLVIDKLFPGQDEITDCDASTVNSWYKGKNGIFYSIFENTSIEDVSDMTYFSNANINSGNGLFYGCSNLKIVPDILSGFAQFSQMFQNCSSLVSVPDIDNQIAVAYHFMFSGCSALKNAPNINMSNAITADNMFSGCISLESVPQYNAEKWQDYNHIFASGPFSYLTDLGGFTNIGKSTKREIFNLSNLPVLTSQSVDNVIDGLYTTDKNLIIIFHQTVYNSLTEEQKSQITSKGWSVTY